MTNSTVKNSTEPKLNPVLVSVVSSRIRAIGERMGLVIERSARSPLLVEGRDFSLGIYSADGTLIEQTEYIPILGYAAAPTMKHVAETFAGKVNEGDVILHNDPFTGGNQPADWKVMKPVFHEGEHIAWVMITAHQADVGGAVPGSYNPDATDIWQEALRITAVKIMEAGEIREDVWNLIFGNVRLSMVEYDTRAMIGACSVGERELKVLLQRYSIPTFNAVVEHMLDAAEVAATRVIELIPDGVYSHSSVVNFDGINAGSTMKIQVKIQVKGDRISFDFTGTDPQTPGYVNAPLAVTLSSVMVSFFMLAGEDIPHNDGIMRNIDIFVPEGTFLNCQFPAASGFGNHLSDQICSAIMAALADALPDRVTAGWNPLLCAIMSGTHGEPKEQFVDILINSSKGGSGGTYGVDGFDHIGLIASGGALGAQDPEMFEIMTPLFVEHFEYAIDSAGPGEWRGGLGVDSKFRILSDDVQASIFGDGDEPEFAAQGLRGGLPGAVNVIDFVYPDGTVLKPLNKDLVSNIPPGTVFRELAGGGGGYGDPHNRPVDTVAKEVRFGYVSVQSAQRDYGVVVDEFGNVDSAATAELRELRS